MKLEIEFDENCPNLVLFLADAKASYEGAIKRYHDSLKEYEELNKRWRRDMTEFEKANLNAQAEAIERQWKRWGVNF